MKKLLPVLLLSLLAACTTPPGYIEPPEGLLSKDKMAAILVDMHIVEGASTFNKIKGDTLEATDYINKIYDKHGVTDSSFKESFSYYAKMPEEYEAVYEIVVEELNKMDVELVKNVPATEKPDIPDGFKDSLKSLIDDQKLKGIQLNSSSLKKDEASSTD